MNRSNAVVSSLLDHPWQFHASDSYLWYCMHHKCDLGETLQFWGTSSTGFLTRCIPENGIIIWGNNSVILNTLEACWVIKLARALCTCTAVIDTDRHTWILINTTLASILATESLPPWIPALISLRLHQYWSQSWHGGRYQSCNLRHH